MQIDATSMHYRELNREIRQAAAAGETKFELLNVNGQRYIGDGLQGDLEIVIHGVPGNDLGVFMNGPTIRVHGNAQDAVGNTMNAGRIIVHGHAGDVLGYGMRCGELLVRGNVGYRVGIHMKAYREMRPVLIAGGTAGDFLGEYMAGGVLIVLGMEGQPGEPLVGHWCGTGMHGGEIYLRGEPEEGRIATESVGVRPVSEAERDQLRPHLETFCAAFGRELDQLTTQPFYRVAPLSHRPYGAKYAA